MSSHTPTPLRLRRTALATLLAATLVACGGSDKDPAIRAQAPSTAWQEALEKISPDGTFTKEAALNLFEATFGGMPGVKAASGKSGLIRSGTQALHAVLAHKNELTDAQRARIEELRTVPDGNDAVTVLNNGKRDLLIAQARQLRQDIKARLGADVPGELGLVFESKDIIDPKSGGVVAGWADARFSGGKYTGCYLHIMPATFAAGSNPITTTAHEMIHCFQAGLHPDEAAWDAAPGWSLEGSAEWGSATLVGPDKLEEDLWPDYIGNPEKPLFKQTYEAIGFYAHLEETGHSPWAAFAKAWGTRGNAAQFAALGATDPRFLDSWASGLTRETDFGAAWDTTGPGITKDITPMPALKVAAGAVKVAAAPYTKKVFTLVVTTDLVDVAISGHARLADGEIDETSLSSRTFCLKPDGCACPESAGQDTTTALKATGALLALSGGPDGTSGTVTGRDLDCTGKGATWHFDAPSRYSGGNSHTVVDAYTCTGLRGPWKGTLHVTHGPATPGDPALDRTVTFGWTFTRDGSAVPKVGPYEDTVFGRKHQITYYPHIQLNEKAGTITILGLEGTEDGSPRLNVSYQLDRIGEPVPVKSGKPGKC